MFAAFFSIIRRAIVFSAAAGLAMPLTAMAQGTNPIPGDGPQCQLQAPATVDFNTVLQPSLTFNMSGICTRYPVLWEWTAPPLDYTGHNMAGQNALFQPLFNSGVMTWTYDNRKVTTVKTIPITITATGTYTFAVRAKDADYIPPNNQPAGFWGPWGAPGYGSINDSGAWTNITATCHPQSETRVIGTGGSLVCTGGRISTMSETRTFCADSVTPTWGPWIPSTTCECPSGLTWNGSACVSGPVCTVTPTPASVAPGGTVNWNVSCSPAATSIAWSPSDLPVGVIPCSTGSACTQVYPEPSMICYSVQGTNVAGTGPMSTPACATVDCPAPQVWSTVQNACGLPPTITAPAFPVGQPAPATIPIVVTGSPVLTCSASNLPTGFVMQANCQLVSTAIGTVVPAVPAGCTVNVRNAWGSDSKPCASNVAAAPSCSATWASKPFVMSSAIRRNPTALHGYDVNGQPIYVQDSNPARTDLAGYAGTTSVQIVVSNADSYSVACDGAPTIGSLPAVDPTTGRATVPVTYSSRTALPAVSYGANGVWDTGTNQYSSMRCDSLGCYPIQFQGSDGNLYNSLPFYNYSAPAQTAITPVSQSACRVTVTNSTTGATGSCVTDNTPLVDGGQAFCRVGLRVGEWSYYLTSGAVTPIKPVDTTKIVVSTLSASAPAVGFSPNTLFAEAQVVAPNVQLQTGPYVPPPGSSPMVAPWNSNTVSCRKRKVSASNVSPAWQSLSLPATGTYVSLSGPLGSQSWGNFGLPRAAYFDGFTSSSTSGFYQEPAASAWRDSLDSINEQYEFECTYSGSGYNNTTGAPVSVSCSSTWTYNPGAVCQPSVTFSSGPSGIQYADGSRSYSGYAAGWNGRVGFVGEKVTLIGNDGVDANTSPFYPGAAYPKLAQFGAGASSRAHVIIAPRATDMATWGPGSTHGWMRNLYPYYTDANIALAGDVVATAPLGVNSLQQTPTLMRGCDGVGGGSWYTPCNHRTVLNVERKLFPGTTAERSSTAQCNIWVGDTVGGGGASCSGCGTGTGTSFGPGNTGGGQTGGSGSGGTGGG